MITTKDLRWYALAQQIAEESNCKDRHGCVIVRGGSVLSLAANRFSVSHPMCKLFLKQSLHAEQRALLKIRYKVDATGATLYSVRLHANPVSRPCIMCLSLLHYAGVKRIVYHDGQEIVKVTI